MIDRPAISVVIPTHQRREVLLRSLRGFGDQATAEPFEVIVVVDGGTDGTAEALTSREWPFPLRVIEQANAGASVARNTGAAAAGAPILLFTDDDMEPDPTVIDIHLAAHAEGADAVVGAMPLHEDSPDTLLSDGVGRWADQLAERCAAPGYVMTADDIYTGHLSVRKGVFDALGGFSTRFTADGAFGNEDIDIGQRLIDVGARINFRADAVTRQRFVVTARQHVRRTRDVGVADVDLLRAHPDFADVPRITSLRGSPTGFAGRTVLRFPRLAPALAGPAELVITALVERGSRARLVRRALRALLGVRYWEGVVSAGGPMDGTAVRVLCWHALQDLSDDLVLGPYGVPPEVLAEQLRTLRDAGWVPLTPDEVVRFIRDGDSVPRRGFLATFDDCYTELAHEGIRILAEAKTPAAAFVVTGRVGDRNRWDERHGARSLPLATWQEIAAMQEAGIELGGHSRTHPALTRVDDDDLRSEVAGARDDLESQGISPRLFAYPHGDHDRRVEAVTAEAGFTVAFTVTPGVAGAGVHPHRVPRFEVLPDDRGRSLVRKVRVGGRWSLLWTPWRRWPDLALAEVRRVRRGLRRRVRQRLRRS